jgi:ABC-2 type transport system permease protein
LATALVGVFKAAVPALLLSVLAYVCWGFDILTVGSRLGLLLFALLLFGWVAGMFTAALILRFGQAAEALVWGVPFLIQPLAAVFYPLDALPTALQPVAWLLPCAHVFEGLRAALRDGQVPAAPLVAALTLDLLYLAAAGMFFGWMLARVRDKGYLTRLGLE